ncbi:4Fe-4S ferredoxin, iron-sulfur binding domain protein [Desulforamulus reducens MI-1]|uniref:Ferredoxin n=1 Tax=Desulforamulus reducens (strain ATCC BAA-1160 / DSM 100696 / MI-1) TaxID=349161 RepID=A4J5K3_DESRM|nr:4Fe-4S dicluster domain-containing protein [Desulforamulus reducens]ABO50356.1 4Fe-4S ferredoxin, iron-sulfur binding domain protein [Desulforamulus reducens MI-1]
MGKVLLVNHLRCVGCGTCEVVCSLVHEGICSPVLSRIRIVRHEKKGYHIPITCASCEKAPCIEACPMEAIQKDKETGGVILHQDQCIGCKQCIQSCPFGHINFNFEKGTAFKCDLCQGDPQCVKFCWTQAISFTSLDAAIDAKRQTFADRIMKELKQET